MVIPSSSHRTIHLGLPAPTHTPNLESQQQVLPTSLPPPSPPPPPSSTPPTTHSLISPLSSAPSTDHHPHRSIPIEVIGEILRFCDPRTLSSTAQVSLAFLELSSPLLYRDVTISSSEALGLLFCSRAQTPSPQLQPHLALSQIVTLTFNIDANTSSAPLPNLHVDRLGSASILHPSTFNLHLHGAVETEELAPLLQLLGPSHVLATASASDLDHQSRPLAINFTPMDWEGINSVVMRNTVPCHLSTWDTQKTRTVFDLRDLSGGDGRLEDMTIWVMLSLSNRSGAEVVFLVNSKKDKKAVMWRWTGTRALSGFSDLGINIEVARR